MSYIELINNFWELDEKWQFSCCETRLYLYLLRTANRLGWEGNWTYGDNKMSACVGVSLNKFKSARDRIVEAGLISFKRGGNGFGNKTRYQILTPKPYPKSQPKVDPKSQPKVEPLNRLRQRLKNNPDACSLPGNVAHAPVEFLENDLLNEIVNFFNENCKGMPPVKVLTQKRKEAVLARHREHGREKVFEMMRKAGASKFLTGQGKSGFVAGFDWIFRPTNFVKTLEGNYDDRKESISTGLDQGKQALYNRIKQEVSSTGNVPGC